MRNGRRQTRALKTIRQSVKQASFILGVSSELMTGRLLARFSSSVSWIHGFRQATVEEDNFRHVDFIISTDVGNLYVQVKSSVHMASVFRSEYPRWIGAIFVPDTDESEEANWTRLLEALTQTRDRILSMRGSRSVEV